MALVVCFTACPLSQGAVRLHAGPPSLQSPALGRALDRNGQFDRLEPVMFGADFRDHGGERGEFGIEPGSEVVSSPRCVMSPIRLPRCSLL